MGDIHGIPDDVLELVFLLLSSPAYLIHAASTCKRWHGIIGSARFLSSFGSVNRRHLVAGSFYNGRYIQASLEYARPSFVAPPPPPCHHHGSLLLMAKAEERLDATHWRVDMVVCDPLARRYKTIFPPMVYPTGHYLKSGPFLLDDGDRADGSIHLSNFRVMCVLHDVHRHYRGSMFKLGRGSWHEYAMDGKKLRSFMGRTRAFLYWHDTGGRTMTAMDRSTAELSYWGLPQSAEHRDKQGTDLKVAAGEDGEPRIIAQGGGGVLRVFAMPHGGGEWEAEKTIQLSEVAAGLPGYLPSYFSGGEEVEVWINVTDAAMVTVLVSTSTFWDFLMEPWAFRLDLETLEAELVDIDDGVSDKTGIPIPKEPLNSVFTLLTWTRRPGARLPPPRFACLPHSFSVDVQAVARHHRRRHLGAGSFYKGRYQPTGLLLRMRTGESTSRRSIAGSSRVAGARPECEEAAARQRGPRRAAVGTSSGNHKKDYRTEDAIVEKRRRRC
nr:unnamed protein product [Digitaria exilis]